jgi:hypothetical protein
MASDSIDNFDNIGNIPNRKGDNYIHDNNNKRLKHLMSPQIFLDVSINLEYKVFRDNNLLREHDLSNSLLFKETSDKRSKISELYYLSRNSIWWSSLIYYLFIGKSDFNLKYCIDFIETYSGRVLTVGELSASLILIVPQLKDQKPINLIRTTDLVLADVLKSGDYIDCCKDYECRMTVAESEQECFSKCMEVLS